MTRPSRGIGIAAACLVALSAVGHAQQGDRPARPLGPVVATSAEAVGDGAVVRAFADGRVLVNDHGKRRLVLFDSTLQRMDIVADTTSRTGNAYGRGLLGLVPFTGDSSLVSDVTTRAFIILDGAGHVARVIRPAQSTSNAMIRLGNPQVGVDGAGHLLFQGPPPFFLALLDDDFVGDTLMTGPDSLPIMRADLETGRMDTLALLKAARIRQAVTKRGGTLGGSGRPAFNPMPAGDDWTVLKDGTVAIVRVDDYRVDRVGRDGRLTRGPVIPIARERISDSAKVVIIGALRAADSLDEANGRRPAGLPRAAFVEPSDLPDYRPRFSSGSARADDEENVWVLLSQTPAASRAGAVYDVIDRSGDLADRVRIPAGSSLVGFGPGVAYLLWYTAGGPRIARALIH